MAFPTSPSNNQVHKEGNRAFVYDSALGVWDQIPEADRSEVDLRRTGVTFPKGMVIQTVFHSDDTNSNSDLNAYSNIPYRSLNTTITPTFSTSKILVMIVVSLGHQDSDTGHVRLVRNPDRSSGVANVNLAIGPADGTSTSATWSVRNASQHCSQNYSMNYLDSPATTNPVTYGIEGFTSGTQAGTFGYNMPENTSTSDVNQGRHMSTITLQEIAQ